MSYFTRPWNIVGLILIVIGVAGAIGFFATDTTDIDAGIVKIAGHGCYVLIILGALFLESPLSRAVLKRVSGGEAQSSGGSNPAPQNITASKDP